MVVTARLVFTLLAFDLGGSAGLYLILIALPYKLAAFVASAAYCALAVAAALNIMERMLGRAEFERMLMREPAGPQP